MAKVTLFEVGAGLGSVELLNANFQLIADALENTVSRDGTTPNQMESDLDLNGNSLVNSGISSDPNRVTTFAEMTDYVSSHASGLVAVSQEVQVSLAGQTVFDLEDISYVTGAHNLGVYVDGVRKFSPQDYTETSPTQVVFTSGQALNAEVTFVVSEYLATVTLPTHTHPWNQITSAPETATRWPTWAEVTDKPTTFAPAAHVHSTSDITSGRLGDEHRGVWVQASQPSSPTLGDLWAW